MWWLLAGLVLLATATLAFSVISDWIGGNTDQNSETAALLKERLDSGNYKIIAGIFNRQGTMTATQAWEVDECDEQLNDLFSRADEDGVVVLEV